jgi:xanthine dehydrogenase accessory factor
MRELLTELTNALEQGEDCVYCVVAETRGSTPQKAGAAMLVFPNGGQRGTLGGGCVEAEVKQRALQALAAGGRPEVFSFCLDDNYGWDDGLICGGRMTILADPLVCSENERHRNSLAYYGTYRRLIEQGRGCTEALVVTGPNPSVGARYLFDASGAVAAQLAQRDITEAVTNHLPLLSDRPRPFVRQGIAYLPILPRVTLLIVGGGHVGQAVARLASEVDFDVWVLDDRESFANKDRFPSASTRIVGDIGTELGKLAKEITPSVFAMIVTRGHAHDEEALYHLARTRAGYVGMIGSKRKIKLIYEDLLARDVPAEALARVHAPLGFSIGSQTVPEIAITIPEARVHVPVG